MTLKDKFVQDDTLHNRKRLGPLAWIVIFTAVLFVLACVLGAYLLVTRNVSPLLPAPKVSPTQIAQQVTITVSSITVTPTVKPSQVITWTVWSTKNPLGQTIYDGPPEIKAWVVRDYQAAQKWKMDHLFERDYLLAHLAEYFTDKGLEKERRDIEDSFDGSLKVISAPKISSTKLGSNQTSASSIDWTREFLRGTTCFWSVSWSVDRSLSAKPVPHLVTVSKVSPSSS